MSCFVFNVIYQAFTNAWRDACAWKGRSKVYVPKGAFYLGGVTFAGPCNCQTYFVIDGVLLAPTNNDDIKKETWVNFAYINYLTISGSGTIDGQGKESWPFNNCNKNDNCPRLAVVRTISWTSLCVVTYNLLIKKKNKILTVSYKKKFFSVLLLMN